MILKGRGHLCLVLDYRATNQHSDLGPAVSFSEPLDMLFNLLCYFHFSLVKEELQRIPLLAPFSLSLGTCPRSQNCALLFSCLLTNPVGNQFETPGCHHIKIILLSSWDVQLRWLSLAITFSIIWEDAKTPRVCRIIQLFYCKWKPSTDYWYLHTNNQGFWLEWTEMCLSMDDFTGHAYSLQMTIF